MLRDLHPGRGMSRRKRTKQGNGKQKREKRKAEHRVHRENLEGTEKPDTTKAGYRPFVR
jgi:hypothetical protein